MMVPFGPLLYKVNIYLFALNSEAKQRLLISLSMRYSTDPISITVSCCGS